MHVGYRKPPEQFVDTFAKMYPKDNQNRLATRVITFVVTHACPLRCTYCYQHNKDKHKMTRETAKKAVDMIFRESLKEDSYLSVNKVKAVVIDFIGGEPLLEIELIDYISEYFKHMASNLKHIWAINYFFSISTNGILYEDKRVLEYLKRNTGRVSIGITIDGNKALHDSCRKFPDGEGSYDIVERAIKHQIKANGSGNTKLTLAPENINYLYEAIVNLYNIGLTDVYANCIFEKGWNLEHARIFYTQLIQLADYILDKERYIKFQTSLFDNTIGKRQGMEHNINWCGGTGSMLAIDTNGELYPCLRYVPFSLKEGIKPLAIGDIFNGIGCTKEQKETINMLNAITRRSQSTKECFDCPISSGCAWCSAYNYEEFGTPDKRAIYICIMHKARVLANAYYWNKLYRRLKIKDRFKLNVPKLWALEIISEEEYVKLNGLANTT